MTRFEQYLLDQGFKRMIKTLNYKFVDAKPDHYSSLENILYWYVKDDKYIIFGLNERHKPPTLICPRPRIKSKEIDPWSDDAMNRVLAKYKPERVFEAIYDQSIIFVV